MPDAFDPLKLSVSEQVAVLRNLRQQAAATLLGIDPRTLRDKAGSAPRNQDKTYSGPDLVAWSAGLAGESAADPELAGPDSPALERFREARAALAEYELQIKQGDLMERADVHTGLVAAGGILRRKVILLRKRFGDEAAQLIADASEDMLRANERLFGGDKKVSK